MLSRGIVVIYVPLVLNREVKPDVQSKRQKITSDHKNRKHFLHLFILKLYKYFHSIVQTELKKDGKLVQNFSVFRKRHA